MEPIPFSPRPLGRWIALHRHQFDAIYVDDPFASLHLVSQPKILQGLPLYGRFHAASIASGIEIDPGATLRDEADACRKLTRVVVPDKTPTADCGPSEFQKIESFGSRTLPSLRFDANPRSNLGLNALGRVCGDLTFPQSHRLILSFLTSIGELELICLRKVLASSWMKGRILGLVDRRRKLQASLLRDASGSIMASRYHVARNIRLH